MPLLQAQPDGQSHAGGCTATQLIIQLTQFGLVAGAPVGVPIPLSVRVVDDCANPVVDATVTITFSNGDPPVRLTSLMNGQYSVTYLPVSQTSQASAVVFATKRTSAGNLTAEIYFKFLASGLQLSQTGLTFQASESGPLPTGRVLTLSAIGIAVDYSVSASTKSGGNWLHVSPAGGNVTSPVALTVTVDQTGLAPGDYYGLIRIDSKTALNAPLLATVVLNVLPARGSTISSGSASLWRLDSQTQNCGSDGLIPSLTVSAGGSQPVASWPASIDVDVVDSTNQPMPYSGLVTASFSNGDAPFSLTPSGIGHWSGTWTPQSPARSVVVTATAQLQDLSGCATYTSPLQPDPPAPIVSVGGTVSAASYKAGSGISPGEMLAIFGKNLAPSGISATSLPLPLQLNNTAILIGGQSLPLLFSSSGQINAVLPFNLSPATVYSVVASDGSKYSVPTPVSIAAANPAVFSTNGMGTGQAHAYKATAGGTLILADAANAATPGDVLVVIATGLGAVDATISPGSSAPADPLARTMGTVSATIGGVNAPVLFSGLAPGFAGLYQVNLAVPPGIATGASVPLVLSANNNSSFPVFVAIK